VEDIAEPSAVIPDRPRSGLIRNLIGPSQDSGFALPRAPE
jgi:hypothetical protein